MRTGTGLVVVMTTMLASASKRSPSLAPLIELGAPEPALRAGALLVEGHRAFSGQPVQRMDAQAQVRGGGLRVEPPVVGGGRVGRDQRAQTLERDRIAGELVEQCARQVAHFRRRSFF